VRVNIGLPSPEKVTGRKYRERIISPFEDALEEVEIALLNDEIASNYDFTITPYGTDTAKIDEWLQGYLKIEMGGELISDFMRIADNTEKKIKNAEAKRLEKIKAKAEKKPDTQKT
jgi:hypothetical protein